MYKTKTGMAVLLPLCGEKTLPGEDTMAYAAEAAALGYHCKSSFRCAALRAFRSIPYARAAVRPFVVGGDANHVLNLMTLL